MRRLTFLLALASACAPGEPPSFPDGGSFSLLTYNVAGLPQGLSGSDPERNIPLISPLLNDLDVVLVQEDFAYAAELRAEVDHPWQSWPKEPEVRAVADGLNRFSRLESPQDVTRRQWETCHGLTDNGSDCFAEKGFSYAPLFLSPDLIVDVYNLHMDAGGSADDIAARDVQLEQLLAFLEETSGPPGEGRAVIVGGDTNLDDGPDDGPFVEEWLERAGLVDACRVLDCGEPERIDRVMVRSGPAVELTVDAWSLDERFVDDDGEPLSDHEAVQADLSWARVTR